MAKTNTFEDRILNFYLRNDAGTESAPSAIEVALYTAASDTEAGTGTEVSGGGYARQTAAFDAPVDGTTQNSSAITFPKASSDLGTVTHFALIDVDSGDVLYMDALDSSFDYNTNVQPEFAAGDLTVTED